ASIFLGGNVEDEATHVAQKFAAHVLEAVMTAVEVLAISENHPRETHGLVLKLEQLRDSAQYSLLKAFVLGKVVGPVDSLSQVEPSEEIVILTGYSAEFLIGLQILQIGFH